MPSMTTMIIMMLTTLATMSRKESLLIGSEDESRMRGMRSLFPFQRHPAAVQQGR